LSGATTPDVLSKWLATYIKFRNFVGFFFFKRKQKKSWAFWKTYYIPQGIVGMAIPSPNVQPKKGILVAF
jgi:hypothetical protein